MLAARSVYRVTGAVNANAVKFPSELLPTSFLGGRQHNVRITETTVNAAVLDEQKFSLPIPEANRHKTLIRELYLPLL